MDQALRELCTQTVQIYPYLRQTATGEALYGTPSVYKAHIGGKNRMVRNTQGQLVTASTKVILSEAVTVSTKDKVVLPVTYAPRQSPILSVAYLYQEDRQSHTAIYLQ